MYIIMYCSIFLNVRVYVGLSFAGRNTVLLFSFVTNGPKKIHGWCDIFDCHLAFSDPSCADEVVEVVNGQTEKILIQVSCLCFSHYLSLGVQLQVVLHCLYEHTPCIFLLEYV